MKLNRFLLTALLVSGFAGPSLADVLFSNLGQSDDGSLGYNNTGDGAASDFQTGGTATTITSVTVLMNNSSSSATLTVTLSIYGDNGSGKPDTSDTSVGTFGTLSIPAGAGYANFTASSAGINLAANTPYWLVGYAGDESLGTLYWAFNNGLGTDAGSTFSTVPGTQIQYDAFGVLPWVNNTSGNLMFELDGTTVPEPIRLALLVTAPIFGAFGAFNWWRRRRVALDSLPGGGHAS